MLLKLRRVILHHYLGKPRNFIALTSNTENVLLTLIIIWLVSGTDWQTLCAPPYYIKEGALMTLVDNN